MYNSFISPIIRILERIGSEMVVILMFQPGINLLNDASSIMQIVNWSSHCLRILRTVKYKYGWFKSNELRDPKLSQFRELYSYGTCIHKMGFLLLPKVTSSNKYF